MPENISISGQVREYNMTPIFNIKVSVYRYYDPVHHVYTDKDGKYHFSIPSGEPITVCFETDWSQNVRGWHPSVVANIQAKQDIVLNRFLMEVSDSKGPNADIDALTAYQFIVNWSVYNDLDKIYAKHAAHSVEQLMIVQPDLLEIKNKLEQFFLKNSKSH
ncbi:hypothetical protein BHU24_17265 [Bacillus pseudomycoides]|uniref:hypothetical protein n=1 Tax=Bacillus pseudomycoides TaxID=64104 RepID=UPI000BEBA91B|nr:hypothetical protein [Bacillus pseudomycoides]MBD5797524.1 hypothetical protein [Bacillus pseudomycoides]MED1476544.1 hypothetical protein [Bacillus pseudomycoides]PDZ08462.1 hypothetical protein CON70_27625 [Bacillus pseudomycoides]PEO78129.1 hypothetical protein CN571_29385 [Bacillus pseudomycoides]